MNERKSCLRTQKCKSYEKAKKHNNRSYRPEYSLPKELAQENISKHWVVNGEKKDARKIFDEFIEKTRNIRTSDGRIVKKVAKKSNFKIPSTKLS